MTRIMKLHTALKAKSSLTNTLNKAKDFLHRLLLLSFYYLPTLPRRFYFFLLALRVRTKGHPICSQPLLLGGQGKIIFGKNVRFGYAKSPAFFSTYTYLEARGVNATIEFHNNISCNNNLSIQADDTTITISDNCFIGTNVEILDSNFHHLAIEKRHTTDPEPRSVFIGKNVFLGNNVKILKGVSIGNNTVIGNGSIVRYSIPDNVIAMGNPCTVIRALN